MKTRLVAGLLLAGATLLAGPKIAIGVGIGIPSAPVYAYPAAPPLGYYAPTPLSAYGPVPGYAAPVPAFVPPAPGFQWVTGYWYFSGGQRLWRSGYWAAPRYARPGWRR